MQKRVVHTTNVLVTERMINWMEFFADIVRMHSQFSSHLLFFSLSDSRFGIFLLVLFCPYRKIPIWEGYAIATTVIINYLGTVFLPNCMANSVKRAFAHFTPASFVHCLALVRSYHIFQVANLDVVLWICNANAMSMRQRNGILNRSQWMRNLPQQQANECFWNIVMLH